MKKQGWLVVALVIAGIAFYLWRDAREEIETDAEPEPVSIEETPGENRNDARLADSASSGSTSPVPEVKFAEDIEAMYVEPGPQYANYTEAELRSLATSDADAAVMLARRTEDADEALEHYEHAVILSGKPGPLVEWLYVRDQGGIEFYNHVLNIDKATLGYEIALIQAQFPYAKNAVREAVRYYEKTLTDAGVPLAPTRAIAEQHFARLTEARLSIVGWPWEQPL